MSIEADQQSGVSREMKLPLAWLSRVSSAGQLEITFSKEMAFPDDLKAATAAPDEAADKLWQERLEISMLSYEQSQISPNLHHWRVTSISPVKLSLRLTFENPFEVSQGDEPDNLLVRFKRGKFTDLDGLSLPPDLTKMANLPS